MNQDFLNHFDGFHLLRPAAIALKGSISFEPPFFLEMSDSDAETSPGAKRARLDRQSTQTFDEDTYELVQNIIDWPGHVKDYFLDACADHGVESNLPGWFRMQSNPFAPTLFVTTHYTGLGTVEHCLSRLAAVFKCREPVFYSGHEIDPAVRGMLMRSGHCPLHLFGDICEQFHPDVTAHMRCVSDVMQGRAEKASAAAKTSAERKHVIDVASTRCMLKLLAIAKQAIVEKKVNQKGWCYKHNAECSFWPTLSEGDKVMEGGGNSCVAFSPQGGHGRWLHRSAIVTAMWLAMTHARQVDMVLQECSNLFNTEEAFAAAFPVEEGWKTKVLKVKCEDVGIPMVRWRNYSWTINTQTVRFVAEIDRESFLSMCSYPVLIDGHAFFIASPDMVQSYLRQKLKQTKGIAHLQPGKVSMDSALEVGAKVRLQDYNALLANVENLDRSSCGVVDLSQNVVVRQKLSSKLPSFLCGSSPWSQWHARAMLPLEMMLAMGWPVDALVSPKNGDPPWLSEFLLEQKPADLVRMTGNQMHCRVVGFFLAYCLSLTDMV